MPVFLPESIKGANDWGDGNSPLSQKKIMPYRILPKGPGCSSVDDKKLNHKKLKKPQPHHQFDCF